MKKLKQFSREAIKPPAKEVTMRRSNALHKGQEIRGLQVKSQDYHAKRREVIDIIYSLKKLVDLPRIEVKIASKREAASPLGLGFTGDICAIMVNGELEGDQLYAVVLHEIVHTAFKVKGHVDTCPLMAPRLRDFDRSKYLAAFLTYAN